MEFENQHPHENVALNVLLMRMRATGLVDDADDADPNADRYPAVSVASGSRLAPS